EAEPRWALERGRAHLRPKDGLAAGVDARAADGVRVTGEQAGSHYPQHQRAQQQGSHSVSLRDLGSATVTQLTSPVKDSRPLLGPGREIRSHSGQPLPRPPGCVLWDAVS